MNTVRLDQVTKLYGEKPAVADVSLSFHSGELTVILGPSGCGKSTLLRILAGLVIADSGDVWFDDRNESETPAWKRDVAMVFQSYALYPHLSVFDNLAFPLRRRGYAKKEIRDKVAQVAADLGLLETLTRKPRRLSGGERQRVALGRALVRSPKLFLLDEPLCNLDARRRIDSRKLVKELHRRLRAPMVYVTHDQEEAMALADNLVVMRDGKLEQVGAPEHVYRNPSSPFVAKFLGNPPMNLLKASHLCRHNAVTTINTEGILGIRPEHISINHTEERHDCFVEGEIVEITRMGRECIVDVQVAETVIRALTRPDWTAPENPAVRISFESRHVARFDSM